MLGKIGHFHGQIFRFIAGHTKSGIELSQDPGHAGQILIGICDPAKSVLGLLIEIIQGIPCCSGTFHNGCISLIKGLSHVHGCFCDLFDSICNAGSSKDLCHAVYSITGLAGCISLIIKSFVGIIQLSLQLFLFSLGIQQLSLQPCHFL